MGRGRFSLLAAAAGAAALVLAAFTAAGPARAGGLAGAATLTTAWHDGHFSIDPGSMVSRSDIVLGAADATPSGSMPLGNGTLGVGAWNPSTGFTAQLNRQDTLPNWLSPGWLVIPGLARLTTAPDFAARLDLYDGTLIETGGGMTVTAYIRADKDELVVNVTGADPAATQTAWLELWNSPLRTVSQSSGSGVAAMSATWTAPGQGGQGQQTFGMLAALTAGGRGVTASSPVTSFPAGSAPGAAYGAEVSFQPSIDGSFRVVVAAPHWAGGAAQATATAMLAQDAAAPAQALAAQHLAWWHRFWGSVGLMELSSADGAAQYFENLRVIDLYAEAGESRDRYPADSSGVALLYRNQEDANLYGTGAWWQWNNRMQVDANIGAGAFALNDPYFNLYTSNLASLEAWTRNQYPGTGGACVPEIMDYNGTGAAISWDTPDVNNIPRCSATASASYNTRTLTTGAEVGLWVWQQYLYTHDLGFLRRNFPEMAAAARFLLSVATTGHTDGLLHTFPSNSHESQWDVHDPTTDIAAEQALFPAVAKAGRLLHADPLLVSQLTRAQAQIEPFARVPDTSTGTDHEPMSAALCNDPQDSAAAAQERAAAAACDQAGNDMLWYSYDVTDTAHNYENISLEPVWPYGVIGDATATPGGDNLTALARRSYTYRTNQPGVSCSGCQPVPAQGAVKDWDTDPLDAARLGMPTEFESAVEQLTEQYSTSPSALGGGTPFYEQIGTATAALQESLVQDYDGMLRIAPAWPSGWNAAGTVAIQGGGRADVQISGGRLTTAAVEAGSGGPIRVRNPWPGQHAEVVDGGDGHTVVVPPTTAGEFTIPSQAGRSYLIQQPDLPVARLSYAPVTGTPATTARSLHVIPPLQATAHGPAHIGIAGPGQPPPDLSSGPAGSGSRVAVSPASQQTVAGQLARFTATVTGPPSPGSIQFYSDGSPLGRPVPLAQGHASLTTTALWPQTHSITAEYLPGPASGTGPADSPPVTARVDAPVTSVQLSRPGPPSGGGTPVTATVRSSDGSAPTGTVQFYSGETPLGSPVALTGGSAATTLPASGPPPVLSAVYIPDSLAWPESLSDLLHLS